MNVVRAQSNAYPIVIFYRDQGTQDAQHILTTRVSRSRYIFFTRWHPSNRECTKLAMWQQWREVSVRYLLGRSRPVPIKLNPSLPLLIQPFFMASGSLSRHTIKSIAGTWTNVHRCSHETLRWPTPCVRLVMRSPTASPLSCSSTPSHVSPWRLHPLRTKVWVQDLSHILS
jgi:hypothetical protein